MKTTYMHSYSVYLDGKYIGIDAPTPVSAVQAAMQKEHSSSVRMVEVQYTTIDRYERNKFYFKCVLQEDQLSYDSCM